MCIRFANCCLFFYNKFNLNVAGFRTGYGYAEAQNINVLLLVELNTDELHFHNDLSLKSEVLCYMIMKYSTPSDVQSMFKGIIFSLFIGGFLSNHDHNLFCNVSWH
jgi:hypothetical protein